MQNCYAEAKIVYIYGIHASYLMWSLYLREKHMFSIKMHASFCITYENNKYTMLLCGDSADVLSQGF